MNLTMSTAIRYLPSGMLRYDRPLEGDIQPSTALWHVRYDLGSYDRRNEGDIRQGAEPAPRGEFQYQT